MSGCLYVVSTPIGNLKDITYRAIEVLKESEFILAEDTRETQKLFSYYGINKKLISCFSSNEAKRCEEVFVKINNGAKVSLVASRGTPTISDPGFFLIKSAVEKGIRVVPIPGPVAAIAAVAASGLPADDFIFVGF